MFTTQQQKIFAIIIFGLILSIFYASSQVLVVDSFQILERAFMFTEGYLVPFGPRSTNTNFIYGSFLSVYNGIFLLIYNDPKSLFVGIVLFQLLGFWLLTKTKFLNINQNFYIVYLFLFWCSPWRTGEVFIWNVCYLFTISALYLYSISLFKDQRNFLATILMILSVILCSNLHNSFIFLGVLGLVLWYKKIIRPHWGAVVIGVFVFGLTLLPTYIAIQNNPEILSMNRGEANTYLFRNLIKFGDTIKGMTYWLRYPSLYFSENTLKNNPMGFLPLDYLWNALKWVAAFGSIIYVFWTNISFFRNPNSDSFLKFLCKWALISLFVTAAISPVSFNYWHLYLIYPFCIIPLAYALSEQRKLKYIIISISLYFTAFTLISSYDSARHKMGVNSSKHYQEAVVNDKETVIENFRPISLKLW